MKKNQHQEEKKRKATAGELPFGTRVVIFLIWTLIITIPLLILGRILGYVFSSKGQAATPWEILSLLTEILSVGLTGFGFLRKVKMTSKHNKQVKQQHEEEEEEEEEMMEKMKKMKEKIKEEVKEEMKKMKMEEEESVWRNFIPSIYFEIISGFSSKKELCCSLLEKPFLIIDGGSKSFGIEKRSGKICFMLGARALSIAWGNNPTYWTWRPSDESRFPVVAKLLNVCWLEITGKVETRMLSPKTMYGAYFVIKIAEQNYGLDTVPGQFSVRFVRGGGECSKARKVYLKRREMQQQQLEFRRKRGDGWMEIEMGEFYNDGEEDGEVEMQLLETAGGHWKCGLIVQGMELRPKVTT